MSAAAFLWLQPVGLLYLSGAYNDPFWHFTISISILKLHNTALHNTAPLHLTSPYNMPSVETEEGFTQSTPVAVVLLKASTLWLVFPWTVRHLHPVAFSLSFSSVSLRRDERDVQYNKCTGPRVSLNLTPDRFRIFSYWVEFFNITSGRFKESKGAMRKKWLKWKGGVDKKRWGGHWQRESLKRRGEEMTGGPGTRRDDVRREGRIESVEKLLETFLPSSATSFTAQQC